MLPDKLIRISDSPANGKVRAIELRRILIYDDLKEIKITTYRRFFDKDKNEADGVGEELTGLIEYQLYEKDLLASNEKLVNPQNGMMAYKVDDDNWIDANGAKVMHPVGMYDYFSAFLNANISVWSLAVQSVLSEDQIYNTWNK